MTVDVVALPIWGVDFRDVKIGGLFQRSPPLQNKGRAERDSTGRERPAK